MTTSTLFADPQDPAIRGLSIFTPEDAPAPVEERPGAEQIALDCPHFQDPSRVTVTRCSDLWDTDGEWLPEGCSHEVQVTDRSGWDCYYAFHVETRTWVLTVL